MKKIALLFILAFVSTACDPYWYMTSNYGYWFVVNNTNQTLKLTYSPYNKYFDIKEVAPGNMIKVAECVYSYYSPSEEPYFDKRLEQINEYGIDTSFIVLSERGHPLKEWSFSDRNISGKHFYKENSWKYSRHIIASYKKGDNIEATWVFEILPEDLEEESDE